MHALSLLYRHLPRLAFACTFGLLFATAASAQTPTVISAASGNITQTGATLGAMITSIGGSALTARGFVLSQTSLNSEPALGGPNVTTLTASGTAVGSFEASAVNLAPRAAYTFRAYATNASGTAHSSAATFTTGGTTNSTGLGSPSPFENRQPSATLTWVICVSNGVFPSTSSSYGAENYLGEIRLVSFDSSIFQSNSGWLPCNGQLLPINQNQALFSLLGTNYGGNGQTTFALPDLRGRVPVGFGSGPGLTPRALGQVGGGESTTLSAANVAGHAHAYAGGATLPGIFTPFDNLQPYLALNFCITSDVSVFDYSVQLAWIRIFAFPFVPGGHRACDGSLVSIASNTALFSKIGTSHGGDGKSTFALPDLRGRTPVGAGQGPGLSPRTLGEIGGTESITLSATELPAHTHTIGGGTTSSTGSSAPFETIQPYLALEFAVSLYGIYGGMTGGLPAVGEIRIVGGSGQRLSDYGWLLCEGQQIPISENETLFALIGTTYGGDGQETFALPDLQSRSGLHAGQGTGLSNYVLGILKGTEQVSLSFATLPAHTHNLDAPPAFTGGDTQSLTLNEDTSATSLAALLGVIDADSGQTLTWTIVSAPAKGALSGFPTAASTPGIATPVRPAGLAYTPAADAFGADSFVVQVGDGFATDTITVNVTIAEANDAPAGADDVLGAVSEDSAPRSIAFSTLLANDSKGPGESSQALTITAVGNAVGGTVIISGANVVFTPAPDFNGLASFVYTLGDNGTTGGFADFKTSTATARFTITAVNDAPAAAVNLSLVLAEGATATITPFRLRFTDPEQADSAITYTVTTLPANGVLRRNGVALALNGTFTQTDINNSLLSYTHNGSEDPGDSFAFSVSDGVGGTTTGLVFAFIITPVNDLPAIPTDTNPAANTVTEGATAGTLVGITAASTDVESATLAYSLVNNAGGRFAINSSTGVVTVANAALIDFETAASHGITVRVADGDGGTRDAAFTIAVANAAPTAPTDTDGAPNRVLVGSANGTPLGLTASAEDPNGGAITYSLANDAGGRFAIDPSTGVVTLADTSLVTTGSGTTYDITVQASDPAGLFQTANFVILILPPTYNTWKVSVFAPQQLDDDAISGPAADPDGDGIVNLLEYAFDLAPLSPDASGLPVPSLVAADGSGYLALRYTRSKRASDLSYALQVSTDLATWTPLTPVQLSVTDHGDTESILVRDTVATTSAPRRFLRLQVTAQ